VSPAVHQRTLSRVKPVNRPPPWAPSPIEPQIVEAEAELFISRVFDSQSV
jgi:hypothetical protein